MTVDISHLVVIGCSLAYCQGLESPKTQGWPALIANKLGVPVVNLSSKGAGNDKIMRRLFEYHYLNSQYDNNPFYIISFSHSSRREEYLHDREDYTVVDMHPESPYRQDGTYFTGPCLYNYNQAVSSRRKLMIQSYILNFLHHNKLNYLTTDYLPDSDPASLEYVAKLMPSAYNQVYQDKYRLQNFNEFSRMYTPLPCLHDGLEVQREILNYTTPKIAELYGNVNAVHKPFVTLTDYANHYQPAGVLRSVESDWF